MYPDTKLKYVASTLAGGTPSVHEPTYWADDPEGTAWVSIGDMSGRRDVLTTNRRVTRAGIEAARLPVGDSGTLLLSMYASLGHTAFLRQRACWNQAILGISPNAGYDKRFLKYSLDALRPNLLELARSNTQANLNAEQVGNLRVPNPRLEEQRRIADFLDAETSRIDQLLGLRRKMYGLVTLRRERIIESILGLDPEKTRRRFIPLKYLVDEITVGIVVTPAAWYVDEGGVPALRGTNISKGNVAAENIVQLSHEGHSRNLKSRLRVGDIVVVRTGQAGAAAIVPKELDGANCIDLILIRPGNRLLSRYVWYLLNSDYVRRQVTEFSVGTIQAHFNVGAMKQVAIPRPSIAEQERAVRLLDEKVGKMDSLLRKLEAQESLLAERRRALVTAAVTGQFDVTTASGRNLTQGV